MTIDGMLTTVDEYRIYQGGSGQYRPEAVAIALDTARKSGAKIPKKKDK